MLLDDIDEGGCCLSHYLKIWADAYDCVGEVKGHFVKLCFNKFIVTSNYTIEELWPKDQKL